MVLLLAAVVLAVLVLGSWIAARHVRSNGGDTLEMRRLEAQADHPELFDRSAPDSTAGKPVVPLRRRERKRVAEVALDAVDRPNGASSDDLDLLARRPPLPDAG